MKHLCFVAVATGIFSGTIIAVKAQTNVNIERLQVGAYPKNSPKFIEGIELVPEVSFNTVSFTPQQIAPAAITTGNMAAMKAKFFGLIELCSPLQFKYAMMTDQEVESINNFALYSFIEDWWATRYQYGGSGRNGIDCSAFTSKLLLKVYGVTIPRIAKDQYDVSNKIALENLAEGDLVFFNTHGGISHVGLYLGNSYFVHSSVQSGVTISSLTDDYYSRKFISGGRMAATPIP